MHPAGKSHSHEPANAGLSAIEGDVGSQCQERGPEWCGTDAREAVVVATPDGKRHDVLHICVSALAALYKEREFFEISRRTATEVRQIF